MPQRLIVIGANAAGLSAASKAKRLKRDLEVTVFEKSGYFSYGACGLPYYVGNVIGKEDELFSLTQADLDRRGISLFSRHEAIAIDRERKVVTVRALEKGEEKEYPYDTLVIATGANPVLPPIEGIGSEGVYVLRTIEDGLKVKRLKGHVAIIGGGLIGLETAEELSGRGLKVTVCEALGRLLPSLPLAYARQVLDELERHGVQVRLGAKVKSVKTENGKAVGIELEDGSFACNSVIVSVGVKPATRIARECGLVLGIEGAIVVDDHMLSSDPSIYACGDCAQTRHILTGKPCYIPLGTTANKMGKVAGSSIGGEVDSFSGVLGSTVTKVFDLSIAMTGLTLQKALDAGFPAKECSIVKNDRASYWPGGGQNQINLVFDAKTGRLLGSQAIGSMTVALRIDTLAACITSGMTVKEIASLDLVYAPPFAPVYDPILIAASQAMKLVEG